MKNQDVYELAKALYEGLPSLSNLAEKMARKHGKAGALSFFEMMGNEVQFFWIDIAFQIINHSKEWEENKGCCCVLSDVERLRIQRRMKVFLLDGEGGLKPCGKCHSCGTYLNYLEMRNVCCPYCGEQI